MQVARCQHLEGSFLQQQLQDGAQSPCPSPLGSRNGSDAPQSVLCDMERAVVVRELFVFLPDQGVLWLGENPPELVL